MALDQSKVGQHIAEQMEAIEADFGEKEGNWTIGDVCTIVEVRGPEGGGVRMRSSAASPHATLGLIKVAELLAISSMGSPN